jgi:phage host-nuclease inhibitor protein Gam
MAKQRSVKPPALNDWQEVDDALREIGESEIRLEGLEGEMTRQINEIKDKYALQSQPVKDRIKELTGQIEGYVEAHRDGFDGKKTRTLNFGETGYRQSTAIVIPKGKEELDEIIRRLRARGMDACVVVTETVDKDALRAYGEDVVRSVGAGWRTSDKFWCEANKERLKDV